MIMEMDAPQFVLLKMDGSATMLQGDQFVN